MLILNPNSVKFGFLAISDVTSIAIDRVASRLITEWTDLGPHIALVDVPEQKITVRIAHGTSATSGHISDGPKPGDAAALSVIFAPTGSDAARKRLTAAAVVTSVRFDVSPSASPNQSTRRPAQRLIDLILVSSDGATDPITITEADAAL